jgi:predicted MFS family arabinose efflux permease
MNRFLSLCRSVLVVTTLLAIVGDVLFLFCFESPPLVMLSRFVVGIASGLTSTTNPMQ